MNTIEKFKNDIRLVVVILNYKTPDLIEGALASLEGELDFSRDRAIVVDNNSSDGSVTKISHMIKSKGWSEWAELIESPVNGGFSAGNNVGIQAYDADYYLLLNSDAFVRKGAISCLLSTMEQSDDIGLVGPRLEWEDGELQVSCFNHLTPLGEFVKSAQTGFITQFFKKFSIKETAMDMSQTNLRPEWISFACVLVRGALFKTVGLMDDGYFMYREDDDYCRRARLLNGWRIIYEKKARVVHLNQGYSNKKYIRYPDFFYHSRSRYFMKYYSRFGLFFANIFWSMGRIISGMRETLTHKETTIHPATVFDIWKGFWK